MNIDYRNWSIRVLIYSLVLLFTVMVMSNKLAERAADPARFMERLNIMFYALWAMNGIGLLLTGLGWKLKEELKKDINFLLVGGGHLATLIGSLILFFSAA